MKGMMNYDLMETIRNTNEWMGASARAMASYPVWGLTLPPATVISDPTPEGSRLDISAHLAAKRAAVNAHRSLRGLVIEDDPEGFVLPEALLDRLLRPHEYFITS